MSRSPAIAPREKITVGPNLHSGISKFLRHPVLRAASRRQFQKKLIIFRLYKILSYAKLLVPDGCSDFSVTEMTPEGNFS